MTTYQRVELPAAAPPFVILLVFPVSCPPLLPSRHLWYLFYSYLLFWWTLLFGYTWVLFVIFAFYVTGALWDIKSC